ncbi:hypothetical protein PMZ80_011187 [Knufia obscura]|uniref:Uncharacterized protein n=1 Tax=Knufia obscura TaxID=1635080 RepID=A0ABR0R8N4_9EURO|nr:hypothetical protein PMZ80_011187 [Knufia obscura]
MDARIYRANDQDRRLIRKYRELKQHLADTKAELGWEKGQKNQVERRGEEGAHLKLQVEILQRKLKECTHENAVLEKKVEKLECRMKEYVDVNQSLQKSMMETRETLLGLCRQHATATMAATVHNDQPVAELFNILHGCFKRAKETLNARHKQKVQKLQEAIDSKDQCNAELQEALDRHEEAYASVVRTLTLRSARLHETALESSTIKALVDEVHANPLPSCGHLESGARSLTGCNIMLCETCDRKMQTEVIADHAVLHCHWCDACCSVIPLPRLFTLPRMSEWSKMVHQVEIVQGDQMG